MPYQNEVEATLRVRSGLAANWTTRNPTLALGEFGIEEDTFLIKVGDGIRTWINLPYLNQLDSQYFKRTSAGALTFSDSFAQTINNLIASAGGSASLVINDDPEQPTDPVNLRYLEWAIAHAGHLTRSVVLELPTEDIDPNNIYMILNDGGTGYDEYMYIEGQWDMVGQTGSSGGGFILEVATENRLGGVKSSSADDYISVTQEGYMTTNKLSTSKLYVPTGDTLILYGGAP